MEKEINITYETLYELLRREKNREELQELSASFYNDVIEYLMGKAGIMEKETEPAKKRQTETELANVKKLIRELYHKRERKIANIAISRARTGSEMDDSKCLLAPERELYEALFDDLITHREKMLESVLGGKAPENDTKLENKDMTIRFIAPVPSFLGPEMESFGPFAKDDIASLPKKVAQVLVEKQRAEKAED